MTISTSMTNFGKYIYQSFRLNTKSRLSLMITVASFLHVFQEVGNTSLKQELKNTYPSIFNGTLSSNQFSLHFFCYYLKNKHSFKSPISYFDLQRSITPGLNICINSGGHSLNGTSSTVAARHYHPPFSNYIIIWEKATTKQYSTCLRAHESKWLIDLTYSINSPELQLLRLP